jgi:hypothetical protein
MAKVKTFEIFTSKRSKTVNAYTLGIVVNKFAKDNDDYNDIIAVVDTGRRQGLITGFWTQQN